MKKHWLILGALMLAAFALRVFQLAAPDIWWDEARNIFTASRALETIASAPELDVHPPLYFYLLHFWMSIVGTSEFVVRFFTVWFGVALVPIVYRLGCYLKDRYLGVWAAFFAALAPFLVEEAHETRMYTLLLFLSTVSIYALLRAVDSRSRVWWLAYALTAAASFFTHYSFIYVLAAQNAFLFFVFVMLWRNPSTLSPASRRAASDAAQDAPLRELFWSWVASQAIIAFLYLFQVPNVLRQMQIYGNPGMTPPSLAQYIVELTRAFFLGTKVQIEQMTWSNVFIVVALIVAAIALGVYRRKALARDGMMLMLAWFIVPLVAYFIVLQKSPQFTPRYGIVAAVPMYIVLAWMFASLSRRQMFVGGVAALFLVFANVGAWQSSFFNPAFFNDDTRGLAQFISENATQDDAVLIDVPYPFFYYYHGAAPAQYLFVDPHTVADKLTQAAQNKKRLFYIRWYKSDTDPQGFVTFLLDKYAQHIDDTSFRGYAVSWYQLPQAPSFEIAPAPQPVAAVFGDKLRLTGYAYGGVVTPKVLDSNLPRATVGGKAWVALWWQALDRLDTNYKVSVQLWNEHGDSVAQDDRMMISDRHFGTTLWAAGESAMNVYLPELDDVKPGNYSLHVIVYDPATGKRLSTGNDESSRIGTFTVVE